MDFNHIINFISQQQKALKELEDLMAHHEKQGNRVGGAYCSSVKEEDIEALKDYVGTMKRAVDTASALATYYKNAGVIQPGKVETEQQATTPEKAEAEKPKRKKNSAPKPEEKKEEPATKEEADWQEFDFLE